MVPTFKYLDYVRSEIFGAAAVLNYDRILTNSLLTSELRLKGSRSPKYRNTERHPPKARITASLLPNFDLQSQVSLQELHIVITLPFKLLCLIAASDHCISTTTEYIPN